MCNAPAAPPAVRLRWRAVPDSVYRREGDRFVPTEWAGSPWSRELQHGGPVCGLVARAAEAAARETGHSVARLGVDLFRPTPLTPLEVEWRSVRRGRRLTLIEASIQSDGREVSRGTALLLAEHPASAGSWMPNEPPPPGPEGIDPLHFMPRGYAQRVPPGFHHSLEVRVTEDELGPAVWLTTPLDLVAGEPVSHLVRAAMLSDLTFGLAGRVLFHRGALPTDSQRVPMINADLTLYLERAPVSEWIAFRRGVVANQRGFGLAEVQQLDREGRYGRSLQALATQG